jgi:hypothetical protein
VNRSQYQLTGAPMDVRISRIRYESKQECTAMEASMLGPKILSGFLIVLTATMLLTVQSGFGGSTSGECRPSPGASARAGLHWYYRVDRTNNRHCWYLHSDGIRIRAHGDVVSPKLRRENVARQAREITPTQSSTIQIAPPQLETAPPALDETPFLAPSLPENTAIDSAATADSAAPARDLPKSVDLDTRELATGSNRYVAENEVTKAEEQLPSASHNVQDVDDGGRQNSLDTANLGSILLAGVLGVALLLLLRDALKIARILHRRAQRRRILAGLETAGSRPASGVWDHAAGSSAPRPTDPAHSSATSLSELLRVLRRVDAELDSPRSFALADVEIITSSTDRGISKDNDLDRRVHSEWSNAAANLIGEKT